MAAQDYTSDYQSTVSTAYTSGGTSLILTSNTGTGLNPLPASGTIFYLKVDNEYFKCTSYTGTTPCTLTVAGAQQGSTAANHLLGAQVTGCWWLPVVIDAVRADQSQMGTYANLPTGGMKKGDRYRCTDAPYEFMYNGTLWVPFVPNFGQVALVIPGNFSWVNQGSSTEDTTSGVSYLLHPANSATDMSCRVMTQPTKPYTITALIRPEIATTFNGCGLCWRDGSGGGMHCVGIAYEGQTNSSADYFKMNSATSFSAHYSGSPQTSWGEGWSYIWIQISDNNTSRIFRLSMDGVHWTVMQTVSNTDFITATQIGYWVKSQNSSFLAAMQLLSWVQT